MSRRSRTDTPELLGAERDEGVARIPEGEDPEAATKTQNATGKPRSRRGRRPVVTGSTVGHRVPRCRAPSVVAMPASATSRTKPRSHRPRGPRDEGQRASIRNVGLDRGASPWRAETTNAAIDDPDTAPMVSIARWSPKAVPRYAGVESAISASRGEVRIPFPMRSPSRAMRTTGQLNATMYSVLAMTESRSRADEDAPPPDPVAHHAADELEERASTLDDALDQPDDRRRRRQHVGEEERDDVDEHLARHVGEEADDPQGDDVAGDAAE